MELRQLEYFAELCRVRNFTKAAENLRVAQPSVTKAIHRLEEELGVQLVDRNQKPLGLTKAGEQFYLRVKNILEEIDLAVEEVSFSSGAVQKVISLGIAPMSGVKLEQMLADCLPPVGNVLYNVIELSAGDICKRLLERNLDLGWVIDWEMPEELEFIPLETQEAVLMLPANSPLCRKEELTFEDLRDEPFSMDIIGSDSILAKIIAERCREAGFTPKCSVSTQQYHPNAQLVIRSVRSGFGLSFIPEHSAENVTDVAVLSMSPPVWIRVGLAYRKDVRLSGNLKQLVAFIREKYPEFVRDNKLTNNRMK